MSNAQSGLGRVFSAFWGMINTLRKIIINLIFFTLLAVILVLVMSDEDKVNIPAKTALVLNLEGELVEQLTAVDPMDEFMREAAGEQEPAPEVLLSDVVLAIENAAEDNRIQAVVLYLQHLGGGGQNKLKIVGTALEKVKAAGKPIYAIGDYYNQSQYYLASYADQILLNPMGLVMLDGYGSYRSYYRSALEKLKINTHVFRVGTFKSAVEPFLRDDMSDAAKQANKDWVNHLWQSYKIDVSARRSLKVTDFDEDLDSFKQKFEAANGDFAQYALDHGWVDKLVDRNQAREIIANSVGWNEDNTSFSQVNLSDYLTSLKPPIPLPATPEQNIAVIHARGTIVDGSKKAGSIGGDSTARLLQRARLDDDVKAVVLRIDSPGGSAFASEVLRAEIDLLQKAGKPVVSSMSSVAASGGYWIASSTDQIWAAPTTITGSIGVFGMFMTFEKTLDYLGIHTDGVGTTDFTGLNIAMPLDKRMADVIQRSVERSYERFITLVAENRNMTPSQVDTIAQGRVWTGSQAQQLGLVDQLGNLDDAIAAAAKLASLEQYDSKVIEQALSPQELFMKQLFGQVSQVLALDQQTKQQPEKLTQLLQAVMKNYAKLNELNDPQGLYTLCIACPN